MRIHRNKEINMIMGKYKTLYQQTVLVLPFRLIMIKKYFINPDIIFLCHVFILM